MGLILGGPKAHKIFLHKRAGICVALHWVNDEPAMALFPVPNRLGAQGCIICLSALHKYARRDGGPTPYLVAQAMEFAKRMAMGTDTHTVHAIADAIMTHVEDVVKMPPMPDSLRKGKGKPLGTISLTQSGRKVIEAEIMDAPPSGLLH